MIGVYVYRDHDGQPLYVGQTEDLARRDRQHWQLAAWRPEACVVDVLSLHDTRTEALAAEKVAIRNLRPACNVDHNPANRRAAAVIAEFAQSFGGAA